MLHLCLVYLDVMASKSLQKSFAIQNISVTLPNSQTIIIRLNSHLIMKQRIVEYDYVRAIAVLLVILGHCSYYAIMTDYGGVDYEINANQTLSGHLIGLITAILYSFHMPLFVALSGCMYSLSVVNNRMRSFRPFVKKKIERLIVPFLFVALIWSIPLKYASGYWEGSVSDVISQIFIGQFLMYGNYNSHLWFLLAIFNIFLLAFVIEKYNLRRKPIAFFCALLIVSVLGQWVSAHGYHLLGITQAMTYLIWFYAGFYFERNRVRINDFITAHIGWISIVVTIMIYAILIYGRGYLLKITGMGYIIYYPLALIGMISTYALCYKALQITPPIY